VSRKIKLAASACALGLALTAVAQAATPEVALVSAPAERFERSIETHQKLSRYGDLLAQARKLDAAPKDSLLDQRRATGAELQAGSTALRERIAKAKRRERREPEFGLAGGVSQATLEAIAACESGGDPTAVNPAGYYGKYQFDTGTWASVGGSGNPAEASEAEQDYRASLLYSRAGASPWPVCGQ
jgi:soluble lytic murein transglycosylase-like protein